jgi:hypothetical protein
MSMRAVVLYGGSACIGLLSSSLFPRLSRFERGIVLVLLGIAWAAVVTVLYPQ